MFWLFLLAVTAILLAVCAFVLSVWSGNEVQRAKRSGITSLVGFAPRSVDPTRLRPGDRVDDVVLQEGDHFLHGVDETEYEVADTYAFKSVRPTWGRLNFIGRPLVYLPTDVDRASWAQARWGPPSGVPLTRLTVGALTVRLAQEPYENWWLLRQPGAATWTVPTELTESGGRVHPAVTLTAAWGWTATGQPAAVTVAGQLVTAPATCVAVDVLLTALSAHQMKP